MGNMTYCMFENTFMDLLQAREKGDWESDDISESEKKYRDKLIALCQDISEDNQL